MCVCVTLSLTLFVIFVLRKQNLFVKFETFYFFVAVVEERERQLKESRTVNFVIQTYFKKEIIKWSDRKLLQHFYIILEYTIHTYI